MSTRQKTAVPVSGSRIDPDKLYRFEASAEFLDVTEWHVRNMVREGRIGYVKTGTERGRRISGQQILDYIAANTVDPGAA